MKTFRILFLISSFLFIESTFGQNCKTYFTFDQDPSNPKKLNFTGSTPPYGYTAKWTFRIRGNVYYDQGQTTSFTLSGSDSFVSTSYHFEDGNGTTCGKTFSYYVQVANGSACNASFTYTKGTDHFKKVSLNGSAVPPGGSAKWKIISHQGAQEVTVDGQNINYTFRVHSKQSMVAYHLYDSLNRFCDLQMQLIDWPDCDAQFRYTTYGDSLVFGDSSSSYNGHVRTWVFNNSSTSSDWRPSYVLQPSDSGVVEACLYIYDSIANCRDTQCMVIYKDSMCRAQYYATIDSTTSYSINLVNSSIGIDNETKYLWIFDRWNYSDEKNPTYQVNHFGKIPVKLYIFTEHCSSHFYDSVGMDSSGNLLKAQGYTIKVVDEEQTASIQTKSSKFNSINCYPNPTKGKLTIEYYTLQSGNGHLQVFNAQGQLLINKSIDSFSGLNEEIINIAEFQQGMYFIKLVSGNQVGVMRVLKSN